MHGLESGQHCLARGRTIGKPGLAPHVKFQALQGGPVLDELIPQIEQIQAEGAIVLLKWDGERKRNHCSVVILRLETDYVWRRDSETIQTTLAQGLADYRARHKA